MPSMLSGLQTTTILSSEWAPTTIFLFHSTAFSYIFRLLNPLLHGPLTAWASNFISDGSDERQEVKLTVEISPLPLPAPAPPISPKAAQNLRQSGETDTPNLQAGRDEFVDQQEGHDEFVDQQAGRDEFVGPPAEILSKTKESKEMVEESKEIVLNETLTLGNSSVEEVMPRVGEERRDLHREFLFRLRRLFPARWRQYWAWRRAERQRLWILALLQSRRYSGMTAHCTERDGKWSKGLEGCSLHNGGSEGRTGNGPETESGGGGGARCSLHKWVACVGAGRCGAGSRWSRKWAEQEVGV